MIKNLQLILVMQFSFIALAISQSTTPQVISTAGSSITGPNNTLSYTIGEIVVETLFDNNNILSQGFQQPCLFRCDYLSSCAYTVMAQQEIQLKETTILSGGVGLANSLKKVKIQSFSVITGSSTFVNAGNVEISNSSIVDYVNSPFVSFDLPEFEPYINVGGSDKKIEDNQSEILVSDKYDKLEIGKNAHVRFSGASVVYIKNLKIKEGATLEFDQCTNIITESDIDIKKNVNINIEDNNVVSFYTEKHIKVDEGCSINANMHALENIKIDGKEDNSTNIKGLLVAEKKFESKKYVFLSYAHNCGSPCPVTPNASLTEQDDDLNKSGVKSRAQLDMKVYPNPATDFMFVEFGNQVHERIEVHIHNVQGALMDKVIIEDGSKPLIRINTSNYPSGIYNLKVYSNSRISDTRQIIITRL